MPQALRRMDDRVLGDRLKRRPDDGEEVEGTPVERTPRTGKGAREALGIVAKVSRLVLLLLALAVVLGIVFTLAPTNADNVIVRNVLELADGAAGPFRDVFTVADDPERELVVNYAFAAVVYGLAGTLIGRLGRKSS